MPGRERRLAIELKLLADVAIIGFPNAGKSTLISVISAAKPKIADYPFTTLTPHLGVVTGKDEATLVVADIPGMIEGAHRGAGLGIRFLKHVERCRLLCHLVDASVSGDAERDIAILEREIEAFRPKSPLGRGCSWLPSAMPSPIPPVGVDRRSGPQTGASLLRDLALRQGRRQGNRSRFSRV